jgi:hypothetical protein
MVHVRHASSCWDMGQTESVCDNTPYVSSELKFRQLTVHHPEDKPNPYVTILLMFLQTTDHRRLEGLTAV